MHFFATAHRSIALFAFSLLVYPHSSPAQWSDDPGVNNPISTATNHQESPIITGDGAGGAIVTWKDRRSGTNYDIYAQRINASGVVQWTADGVAISTAAGDQIKPTIISDGAGGAIIAWQDHRSGTVDDIYAQRINASGAVQWTTDGVAISTISTENKDSPALTSDGAEGAIITWQRIGTTYDIYAQRINASGAVQWTTDGVAISTAANGQFFPQIASDGAGGAIITWPDQRGGSNFDIYAQRINASGAVQWTADGVVISTATVNDYQIGLTITSDGAGGAIITWEDYRGGVYYDIYAQRINASGVVQWTADGVAISTAANHQYDPAITNDGASGAIIAWHDHRGGTDSDIYAQRINASGAVQWTADGVAISTTSGAELYAKVTSDGAGGAIIAWQDLRNGDADVYSQQINASGAVQWTANGVAISTLVTNAQESPTIISDNAGGAIITWQDFRSTTEWDVYASRVFDSGALPVELVSISCQSSKNSVAVTWTTGTETSNYGFEIERRQVQGNATSSMDPGTWNQIGFVRGSGTSSSPRVYSFLDENLSPGRYAYRIRQVDLSGDFTYTQGTEVEIGVPAEFALQQNYPNPFNPSTTIAYQLTTNSRVRLKIYNTLGQEVITLLDADRSAGHHQEVWNAASLASGSYICQLTAIDGAGKEIVEWKVVMLVK